MPRYKKILIILSIVLVVALAILLIVKNIKKPQEELTLRSPASPPSPIEISGPPLDTYIATRPSLSQAKEQLKQNLVSPLGGAGSLLITPEFRIDYLPSPDIFQVEIKSIYINDAKEKAVAWFKEKGFSEEDICNLPITFYLSGEVVKQYEGSGLVFYPLPDFCQ